MRIGIIGTGIAGLTAGWLFKKNGHEVVMFEKLSKLGMSAHAVTVPTRSGPKQIDVPPRMFNEAQWPNLVKLYDHLGVQYEHVCLSKSFRRHDGKSYLNLDSSFKPKMKVSLLSNKVRRIVADAARLMEQVTHMDQLDIDLNFRDFLTHNAYSEAFVYEFLYPTLSSTVCTCSYAALDKYPARTVIEALVQIIGTDLSQSRQLMRTSRGTADVARRLSQDIDQIRFDTTVVSARRSGEGATVVFEKESRQSEENFDHLIVATQANQAIRFLTGISQNEARLLNSFHYEDVDTIVHTDCAMMPSKISNWSHFNFVVRPDASTCCVWMNRFCPNVDFEGNVFQTISPFAEVDEATVIARRRLQRPTVTRESDLAAAELKEMQVLDRQRRVWFCGSFATQGVPLLETGVSSSLIVASCLGQDLHAPFRRHDLAFAD